MPKNLYDIQQAYRDLVQQIEDADGELSPELELAIKIDEHEWEEKAQAYRHIIREKKYAAEMFAHEARRLLEYARREEAVADKLKARLLAAVIERGGKCKAGNFSFWTITTKAVDFSGDIGSMPAELTRTTVEPDKRAIKEFLETCTPESRFTLNELGCRLVENTSLGMR